MAKNNQANLNLMTSESNLFAFNETHAKTPIFLGAQRPLTDTDFNYIKWLWRKEEKYRFLQPDVLFERCTAVAFAFLACSSGNAFSLVRKRWMCTHLCGRADEVACVLYMYYIVISWACVFMCVDCIACACWTVFNSVRTSIARNQIEFSLDFTRQTFATQAFLSKWKSPLKRKWLHEVAA